MAKSTHSQRQRSSEKISNFSQRERIAAPYKPKTILKKTTEELLNDANTIITQKNIELGNANRLIKSLQKEKEEAEAVAEEIQRTFNYQPIVPEWLSGRDANPGTRGGPLTILSDLHYGERVKAAQVNDVNEYTPEIATQRLKRYVNNVIDLCENHMGRAAAKYPGLVLCMGGDMVSGNIVEELRNTDLRTPEQSKHELTDLLAGVVDNLATYFGRLFIPCVVGNHGRQTLKTHYKDTVFHNHDWGVYMNLARVFKDNKNVKFYIPEAFDAYFTLFGHRFFLTHGDQLGVRGGDGIIGNLGPIARGAIKIRNSEAQIGRNIDTALFCHFHNYYDLQTVVVNGSVKGYDEFSKNALRASYERPTQALLFAHPEWGRTIRTPIYLEKKQTARENQVWVEWAL